MCESGTELGPQVCDRKEVRSVLKEKDYHNAIQRFQQTLRTFSGLQKYAHPLAWLTWVEKPPDESKPKTTSLLDSHNFAFNNEYFFQFIKFFDHQRRIQSCSICMAMLSQILTWLKRKKRGQTWNGTLHNTWEDYQELLQPSAFHIHQSGRWVKKIHLLPTCFLLKHQKASMPTWQNKTGSSKWVTEGEVSDDTG